VKGKREKNSLRDGGGGKGYKGNYRKGGGSLRGKDSLPKREIANGKKKSHSEKGANHYQGESLTAKKKGFLF